RLNLNPPIQMEKPGPETAWETRNALSECENQTYRRFDPHTKKGHLADAILPHLAGKVSIIR
ncbi:hypothetical protein, partial [Gordonia desulfuricans]|uniref:hypothetical protein n=1 Tax=Gordonia desulfuricans TaxID=89051 RepID=UPI001C3F4BE8